jgi:hypothetical protein
MRCPFLREGTAKSCHASMFRKMILRPAEQFEDAERCSSPLYAACSEFQNLPAPPSPGSACPFLRESLVQFCAAAGLKTFVPYNESSLARCGSSNHRYCDLYISLEQPVPAGGLHTPPAVDEKLYYAKNHMWMEDAVDDGSVHIGVDDFFMRTFKAIDSIHFIEAKGYTLPTIVMSTSGIELQFTFPLAMHITGVNVGLRVSARKAFENSYRLSWIFEGKPPAGPSPELDAWCRKRDSLLLHGREAAEWMHSEEQRLTRFVCDTLDDYHHSASEMLDDEEPVRRDQAGFPKEEALLVYQEFFSSHGSTGLS